MKDNELFHDARNVINISIYTFLKSIYFYRRHKS